MQKRVKAILLVLTILCCALGVRLFVVQIKDGKELQQRATDQWTRDLKMTAKRGSFFDCTSDAIAVSYTTYNVYVRGREVTDLEMEADTLSTILNISKDKLKEKMSKKNVSEVLLKMQVEGEDAEKIYKAKLDGIYLSENVGRKYIYGNMLTQILGFTSSDNVGQAGLEAFLNDYLTGEDGYSFVQSDLRGKEIDNKLRHYVNGVAGDDVTLTINSKVQILLEQILQQAFLEQKAKGVTGIVMNAKTSQVIAISSKPSFDLNDVPRDDLKTLFDQMRMTAVTDAYEPGSTFKILTLAAALEEGVVDLNDRFYCPGYRIVDGQKIKCWRTIGHGSQNLTEAFANSCNCCFMDLALRLGKDKFCEYMEKFGIGKKTGITIHGESSGIVMKKNQIKNVDLARMGFGHAIAVTPIQLLTAVAGVTNGGILRTPSVIEKAVDVNGKITFSPSINEKRIISSETSKLVNQLLQKAENKKEDYSFVEGYNVGGKTGTAQKYSETGGIAQGKYISSFIGTYPADEPEYLLMILVDEASAGAYYGAIVAAPYGKMFFSKLFEMLNIPKDDPKHILEEVVMPDIVGKSLAEAAAELKKCGLFYEVDGNSGVVKEQLPPAGTRIYKGQTVLIVT